MTLEPVAARRDKDPTAHIQWQNTEVCLDVQCACGEDLHYDGITTGQVQCPTCSAVWVLTTGLRLRSAMDFQHDPTLMTADDDEQAATPDR